MEYRIVGKNNCIYCHRARSFLEIKGHTYKYEMIEEDITMEELLKIAPNAKTFPQIWKGDSYIGGYTELVDSYDG